MNIKTGFFLSALFLFAPVISHACSCITEGNLIERRNLSALAFVGHRVSETVDSAQGIRKMKFAVQKSWRYGKRIKAKRKWIETSLEPSLCGFKADSGKRAIIFANQSTEKGRKFFQTTLCSGNILEPTKAHIDSLIVSR